MENITTELWATYGALALFAILFIIDWVDNKKTIKEEKAKLEEEKKRTNEVLEALAVSNNNIAKSLDLLRSATEDQHSKLEQHDERAIREFTHIREELIKIRSSKK